MNKIFIASDHAGFKLKKSVITKLSKQRKIIDLGPKSIDKVAHHMPADGSVWVTNNLKYHNAFNGGEENRVHLVACVLDYKFN